MYVSVTANLMKVKESTNITCRTPEAVTDYCKDIADLAQESFQIITLNTKNNIIDRHMISLGLANASLVHPREIYRPCIQDNASALVLVHNHPSGNLTPSIEDIKITRQLIEAGKIIDIKPLDHVIIAKKDKVISLSMKEQGICQF